MQCPGKQLPRSCFAPKQSTILVCALTMRTNCLEPPFLSAIERLGACDGRRSSHVGSCSCIARDGHHRGFFVSRVIPLPCCAASGRSPCAFSSRFRGVVELVQLLVYRPSLTRGVKWGIPVMTIVAWLFEAFPLPRREPSSLVHR